MIRSLNIRPGERWTGGRVALHMALATSPEPTLRRPKPRRSRLWHLVAVAYLVPPGAALAMVAALWILRRGL
jgi:hypothetical protein